MEEFAQATEEFIAELTEKHAKQIKALIKANNEAMAKLTAVLLENKSPSAVATVPAAAREPNSKQSERAQIWAEKKCNATECPHCKKFHPNRLHSQCWELEANASKRPAGWKSVKTT